MKISRSKVIEIVVALTLFVFLFVYSFVFANTIDEDTYAFSINNNVFKEAITENVEFINLASEPKEEIVYDNMTLNELADKLNRTLSSNLSGYGEFIASYSLEKGVDPYLATAIMMHETGCEWGCSSLVRSCNNVGGMKGSGCGEYGYFNTLEEGIQRFIDNLYNNYYAYGLTNANLMGNKYAEDPEWARKVNVHIEKIKNR